MTVDVEVPASFATKAAWTIETLLSTCASPAPDVAYPGPALPGSEHAWRLFESGLSRRPAAAAGGMLDFGDGVEDVVASAFWHLSRWEERAGSARDPHGRFPAAAALVPPGAEAPVDALLDRFRDATGATPRPGRFTVALTHDIDRPRRFTGRRALLGAAARAKAAARSGNRSELAAELSGLAALPAHRRRGTDPNWSFERMRELEAARGGRATHFVMAGHTHPADGVDSAAYDRARGAVVAQVLGQGDELGLHPSYEAGGRPELLREQRRRLEALAGMPVEGVRFHYLRHDVHTTLPQLEALGFGYDSSHAYAETPGLRAGFSFPYRPYDLAADRPLDLVELPLAVMDASLADARYLGLQPDQGLARATAVLERVAERSGTVAVLWHNDRFSRAYARGWDRVYERLLDWVAARDGSLVSAGQAVAGFRPLTVSG